MIYEKKNLKDRKKPQQISETCKLSNSSTSFHQSVLSCLSREKVKVVLKTDKKKKNIYISRSQVEKTPN